jgi:hypothetical protein
MKQEKVIIGRYNIEKTMAALKEYSKTSEDVTYTYKII